MSGREPSGRKSVRRFGLIDTRREGRKPPRTQHKRRIDVERAAERVYQLSNAAMRAAGRRASRSRLNPQDELQKVCVIRIELGLSMTLLLVR